MRKRWATFLAALALSLGINAAWGQAPPPPPPGPLPAPVPMTEELKQGDAHAVAPGAPGAPIVPAGPGLSGAPGPIPSVSVPAPAVIIPGNGGCNDGGCGGGCSFYVNGGFYFLKPAWSSNPNQAFSTTTTTGGAAPTSTTSANNFGSSFDPGYSFQIGATSASGLGARFGYFNYTTSSDTSAIFGVPGTALGLPGGTTFAFPGTGVGVGVAATNELSIQVYDLEATVSSGCNGWNMLWGFGVRYVNLDQSYGLNAFSPAGVLTDNVTSSNDFKGVGPTFSLEAHKKCGCSCFGVYGTARGSVLFGDRDQTTMTAGSTFAGGGTTLVTSSSRDVVAIGEIELGVEASMPITCRCRLFGQLGFVGQAWLGAGNATPLLNGSTANSSSNLGLYGGVLRVGVAF